MLEHVNAVANIAVRNLATALDGDVHVAGDMWVAWFKDPVGNILDVVNG